MFGMKSCSALVFRFCCSLLFIAICVHDGVMARPGQRARKTTKKYAMYVWTTGFDSDISGCDVTKFMDWNTAEVKSTCFTHTWNSKEKRQWLWDTCNLSGREVATLFVSDMHHNLRDLYNHHTNCHSPDIVMVKDMLTEGHSQGIKIYGLYAVSDPDVSEQNLVKYIVNYNDKCATSNVQRFDGVAVNNEAYASIKCGDLAARQTYLDDLQNIALEAGKQTHGTLLSHYSMSWHWSRCGGVISDITWNGKTQPVNHHMIDIFDSTDVQVGYMEFAQISDRMKAAGYDYAVSTGKPIYTTVYTNKGNPCQTTFFPSPSCSHKGHNETNMFATFDAFSTHGIEHAQPCIHYFRGAYSSGGHPDWPKHSTVNNPVVG